jgi:hypothetical protein
MHLDIYYVEIHNKSNACRKKIKICYNLEHWCANLGYGMYVCQLCFGISVLSSPVTWLNCWLFLCVPDLFSRSLCLVGLTSKKRRGRAVRLGKIRTREIYLHIAVPPYTVGKICHIFGAIYENLIKTIFRSFQKIWNYAH